MLAKVNYPTCKRCGYKFSTRKRRPLWFKLFFFWSPIKRFYCTTCERKAYIWWPDPEEQPLVNSK